MIKYLIAASELEDEGAKKIIGINAIRLISKANHAINQEEEEQANSVLTIKIRLITR